MRLPQHTAHVSTVYDDSKTKGLSHNFLTTLLPAVLLDQDLIY